MSKEEKREKTEEKRIKGTEELDHGVTTLQDTECQGESMKFTLKTTDNARHCKPAATATAYFRKH